MSSEKEITKPIASKADLKKLFSATDTGELPIVTEEEARSALAEKHALAALAPQSDYPVALGDQDLQASIDFTPTSSEDTLNASVLANITRDENITGDFDPEFVLDLDAEKDDVQSVPDTEKIDKAISPVLEGGLTAIEMDQALPKNNEKEIGIKSSRKAWIEIICTFGPILVALLLFIASVRSFTPSQQGQAKSASPTSTRSIIDLKVRH